MIKQHFLKIGLGILFFVVIAVALLFKSNNITVKAKNNTNIEFYAATSLCARDEQIIFSCSTVKNKIVSVCASKGLNSEKGYVQYRFGNQSKIELEVPKDRSQSLNTFKYSRYTRPLVTMLTLKFENQGITYEIHQDDNSEEKPPVSDASVDITNANGKQISSVTCKMPTQGSLMKLEGIVPNDENGF